MNPIITSIFTADPSAHVWGDGSKVYIYPSHDMDPARGCDLMDKYHVFSSEDMVNWLDEGEILSAADSKWGRKEGGFMWAPDCAFRNGTYYFYYPHPSDTKWNDTWKIGVATSKYPNKDFVDQGYVPNLSGFALIDPCVFIDDDNTPYIYIGGGSRCFGAILNDDMISIKDDMVPMVGLDDFHEATWVFKRNGIYYLTYADNDHGKNKMKYCISDSPLGPWDYKGIFLEATGCDTTHGSVAEFKGQWYLFYHNQDISGRGNLRSMCIDELYFNDDGTIKMVKQTKTSVKPVGTPKPLGVNAVKYDIKGIELGGGAVIKGNEVHDLHIVGAYCQFNNIDGKNGGRAALYFNFSSAKDWSKLYLHINGVDHSLINFKGTGDWNKFDGIAAITVKFNAGKTNSVRLTGFEGGIDLVSLSVDMLD